MAPAPPPSTPCIVVPLYIYPLSGAWDSIFEAARANPHVSFIVIVNPCNGPGPDLFPDSSYAANLSRLGSLGNVVPLGYVHCSYGDRPVADVERDIGTYFGWNERFRVDGIFFDEAPSSVERIPLMAGLAQFTRSRWQHDTGRPGLVVLNPGVVVDPGYYEHADHIVVFEQSEQHWNEYFTTQGVAQIPSHLSAKAVVMVHSCLGDAASLARQIGELGFGGLYLTDQLGGGYNRWPDSWSLIVDEVGRVCEPQVGSGASGETAQV
ncbi:hypothetical protein CEP54_006444 [Fusarium duplospermum]|uniref:Spherulin-4 n=1 Tax=Fusarium duplospermum TaxID=1325734 RepID=A0A428Q6Y3_9HYPO|nr:hypothetical protein CEP54_006444 [Fusarium duplospermum]